MATATANPVTLILKNTRERMNISITDASDTPVTPATVTLKVMDLGDKVIYVDGIPNFTLTGTASSTTSSTTVTGNKTQFLTELDVGDSISLLGGQTGVVSRIDSNTSLELSAAATVTLSGVAVTKTTSRLVSPSTGVYYIDWGDATANSNASAQTETNTTGTRLFVWEVEDALNDLSVTVQTARIVTAKTLSLLPGFRKMIDKSVKLVNTDNECYLGYTDAHLIQYLEEGLSIINSYQPYPTFCTLDEFPLQYVHVLHLSGLIAGVMSQTLFAIDTDIPNYSDQGNSFVIQHQPQLAAFLNTATQQADKLIPLMKHHFVRTGSLHIEAGANFRLAQLIQSAPNGSLFRNIYFRGN